MSTLAAVSPLERNALQVDAFGELEPVSRPGGQGRVYRPALAPSELGPEPIVVKLYRRPPSMAAAHVLGEMVAWSGSLEVQERARLRQVAAWPLAVVYSGPMPVGIALEDVSGRFAAPFVMPSGRRERVLMALEHLLGDDSYLELRGLGVRLDADMRARVAERICEALGYLHRQGIVASDIAPSNLLVSFGVGEPSVCFIDCDSMVFRGRQALAPVETGDWNVPFDEPLGTRAADAYKLGLIVLRLFARSHDARTVEPHLRHVPSELRGLLVRALGADAVNRPPTGEWQLALRQVLARGQLGERYPGPAPRVRAVAPASVGVRAPAPLGVRAPAVAPAPPARRRTGPVWLQPAVVVLWLLAGTAVLALILSRLFAAAVPRWESGPAPQAPAIYQIYPGGGPVPGQFQGQGGQFPGQGGQFPGQGGQFPGQGGSSP